MGYYKTVIEFMKNHKLKIAIVVFIVIAAVILYFVFRKKSSQSNKPTFEFELPASVLPPPKNLQQKCIHLKLLY